MASDEKLKAEIAEISQRPKNVEYSELERILMQVGCGKPKPTKHGFLFKIPGCSKHLMLNRHADGRNKLPSYCVKQFLERMLEIGMIL